MIRRAGTERTKLAELGALHQLDGQGEEAAVDQGVVTDDRLRLVFTCCHPALSVEARVALTLKVVAGLSTAEVARMFLVEESTMSQRLLRAKKKIANAAIPYRVPEARDLTERVDGVLAVVYLVFTQGYAGAAAAELADEAIRLGRLVVDLIEFCTAEAPLWNTVSISGYHIREAGSTALQELAFTLADGRHYVEETLRRGCAIDTFAPRLSFFFNAHNNLFEEIAKYRAARRLWAEMMRDEFGARDPASWKLRFHAQTAGCTLQDRQPEVNLVRVAYQALAAVLGGCQSLHTNSMDETLALPSEHAVTLALRGGPGVEVWAVEVNERAPK